MKNSRLGFVLKLGVILFLVEENCGRALKKRADRYCAIRINGDLMEPQPLLLCTKNDQKDFVYPYEPGSLHLVALFGQSFRIACPGSSLKLSRAKVTLNDTIVTCVGNDVYYVPDADIETGIHRISCLKYPSFLAKRTGLSCGDGITYEIGFPVERRVSSRTHEDFIDVIDLCHDENLAHTIYAHSKIPAVIDAAQRSFPRTSFRKGSFFRGISISKVYRRDIQRGTIERILNSTELAWHFIPEKVFSVLPVYFAIILYVINSIIRECRDSDIRTEVSDLGNPCTTYNFQNMSFGQMCPSKGSFYLARGHLVAKTDFIYGAQQRATFFYANAVPMWQNINAGNWYKMEESVRLYASERDLDLDVWTGSMGVLSLEDVENRQREIYLHVDDDDRAVPVPKILFKIVYSAQTQSGIVFLTANNPYLHALTPDYRVCRDVCSKVHYLKWKPDDGVRGFSYCCEVDEFRLAFPNIPCFHTKRLLL